MRIPLRIDMDILYEYQSELNSLIKTCEKLNSQTELLEEQLKNSGVSKEDVTTVLKILVGDK